MEVIVLVSWVSSTDGGRQSHPPHGRYYCVAKFPCDLNIGGTWSVVFDFEPYEVKHSQMMSYGRCRFLVENAPHHWLIEFSNFDIYEGPHKVATVQILNHILI